MKMTIWFDMDGTIADFYNVENWLEKIRRYDTSPYRDAAAYVNLSLLARRLNQLQSRGYEIGIISWGSKDPNKQFLYDIRREKNKWLRRHLASVTFNRIHIVEYGISKNNFRKNSNDILFDDNFDIRKEWGENSYPPEKIFDVLFSL